MATARIAQLAAHIKEDGAAAPISPNATAGTGKRLTKLSRSIKGKVAIVTGGLEFSAGVIPSTEWS